MSVWLWVVGVLGVFLSAVLSGLITAEIQGWINLIPYAILRLAASRLEPSQRIAFYEGEWLPELESIHGSIESRPITRLIVEIKYAVGLLWSARQITRQAARTLPPNYSDDSNDAQNAVEKGSSRPQPESVRIRWVTPPRNADGLETIQYGLADGDDGGIYMSQSRNDPAFRLPWSAAEALAKSIEACFDRNAF